MTGTYWFDIAPLLEKAEQPPASPTLAEARAAWKGSRGLGKVRALRTVDPRKVAGELYNHAPVRRVQRFAEANGLQYERYVSGAREDLPGLIFRTPTSTDDVVTWPGVPRVELGNRGPRTEALGQRSWGYIALRHGLSLPHLVLDARANDEDAPHGGGPRKSSLGSATGAPPSTDERTARVDLESGADVFHAYAETGHEEAARTLMSGEALARMTAIASSFDVEVVDGWLFLYGFEFDVVTDDPEMWAWVFTVITSAIEVLRLWGLDAEQPPFHSTQYVARPARLAELPRQITARTYPNRDRETWFDVIAEFVPIL